MVSDSRILEFCVLFARVQQSFGLKIKTIQLISKENNGVVSIKPCCLLQCGPPVPPLPTSPRPAPPGSPAGTAQVGAHAAPRVRTPEASRSKNPPAARTKPPAVAYFPRWRPRTLNQGCQGSRSGRWNGAGTSLLMLDMRRTTGWSRSSSSPVGSGTTRGGPGSLGATGPSWMSRSRIQLVPAGARTWSRSVRAPRCWSRLGDTGSSSTLPSSPPSPGWGRPAGGRLRCAGRRERHGSDCPTATAPFWLLYT